MDLFDLSTFIYSSIFEKQKYSANNIKTIDIKQTES
jgi:hypothetical protein